MSYYPVDSGVDFNYNGTGASLTTSRGMFYPYIDTNVTWTTNGGTLSGSPYANGASVNIDLGLSGTTFANEPTFEAYTLSGDSIGATGLTLILQQVTYLEQLHQIILIQHIILQLLKM